MSMDSMVRDMRNRFLVALVFTIPIVLWSMVGTELLGTELATPFGIDRDVWQLLLSLPIVFYASTIFFKGAVSALRAQDAGHDGPGRRRDRHRLALLGRRDVLHRGRGLLRVRRHARDLRAARPLVRDARPRRRQRRRPRAAGPRAAEGGRAARRRARRGPDGRSAGRRPAAHPPRLEGAGRRERRGGREPGRRVHRHRREPPGQEERRAISSSARRSTRTAPCAPVPPPSAPTPRLRRSSSSSKRRRTPRRPASGWPTRPRSGSSWSRSSAAG